MGLLALHSAHFSKIFRRLIGTTCSLAWRNSGDTELVWTVNPSHPITAGIPQPIVITEHEMYGEFFDIPAPDELIFLSTFSGGEVFRSGCCWRRGKGKVFYFSPGDQAYRSTTTPTSNGCWPMRCSGPIPDRASALRRRLSPTCRTTSTRCPSGKHRGMNHTDRLRAGVIGLGWAGQQHMDGYAAAADVDLVALAEWSPMRCSSLATSTTSAAAALRGLARSY
jgi:hypothetical protein